MKTCIRCKKLKDLGEFYAHPQMRDGHLNKCKECARADTVSNRRAHIAYYLAYDRRRATKHRMRVSTIRYRATNPEKSRAHCAVSNALRSGKITRKPCEVCGSLVVEAHHDDYSKPLDVRWLCFRHHREIHGNKHFSSDLN